MADNEDDLVDFDEEEVRDAAWEGKPPSDSAPPQTCGERQCRSHC